MYYYEIGIINDFILYIKGDEMKYICVTGLYREWEPYGSSATEYLSMVLSDPEASVTPISKKKVILLGLPLCK